MPTFDVVNMEIEKSTLAKRQLQQIGELCSTVQVICKLNPEARIICIGKLQDLVKHLSERKNLRPQRLRKLEPPLPLRKKGFVEPSDIDTIGTNESHMRYTADSEREEKSGSL